MQPNVHEGDLYKIAEVAEFRFEIRYGYRDAGERQLWGPSPQYPDFLAQPHFTREGFPLATAYQDVCAHYRAKASASGEGWCDDCIHFQKLEEYIGLCRCPHRCAGGEAPECPRSGGSL